MVLFRKKAVDQPVVADQPPMVGSIQRGALQVPVPQEQKADVFAEAVERYNRVYASAFESGEMGQVQTLLFAVYVELVALRKAVEEK